MRLPHAWSRCDRGGCVCRGVEALTELVQALPADLPAAVFVVLHVPPFHTSVLPKILSRHTRLTTSHAQDGEPIRHGHIYIAPPNQHLVLRRGHVRVVRGPHENGHRPAIDPLFRSAARFYGGRAVGVVLSGVLDDGAAGLDTVKRAGGIAIVQDPETALYGSMPRNAMLVTAVDYVLPLQKIAMVLDRLAREPVPDEEVEAVSDVPEPIDSPELSEEEQAGAPSGYSCPTCHGVLWEHHEGDLLHFRCRVGHAFAASSLIAAQAESVEMVLWEAVRALEEIAALRRRLADHLQARGHRLSAKRFDEQAVESTRSAQLLRRLLVDSKLVDNGESAEGEELAR